MFLGWCTFGCSLLSRRLFQWPGYLALYSLDLNTCTIISRFFCSWCIRSSTFETYLEEEILQQAGKKLFSFCWSCFVRLGRARDTNFVSGVSRQWNRMRLSYRIYQFCGTSKNIMTHKICDSGNVCIQAIWLWDIFASLYSKLVVQVTRV